MGSIVDHSLEKVKDTQLKEARQLWEAEYPDDAFDVDPNQVNHKYLDPTFLDPFSYDIIAAANRQKEFYYQVSSIIIYFNCHPLT